MPIDVLVHDVRLAGRTPAARSAMIVFEVGEDTRITDFFDHVVSIADQRGGIGRLSIMAHGTIVTRDNTSAIIFCHEFISFENVHMFSTLRDKVERMVLFVCHAAETTMSPHGDGDELCRQIAYLAHAEVTAAREVQAYTTIEECSLFECDESAIEFGEWEGPIVVYGRDGNVISEYQNPSAWRSSDGELHDPRLEAQP